MFIFLGLYRLWCWIMVSFLTRLPVNRVAWKQARGGRGLPHLHHRHLFHAGKNDFNICPTSVQNASCMWGSFSLCLLSLFFLLSLLASGWSSITEQPFFFLLTKQQKMSLDLRLARWQFSSRRRCGHANKSISGATWRMGFVGHLDVREFIFQEEHASARFIRLGKRFGGRPRGLEAQLANGCSSLAPLKNTPSDGIRRACSRWDLGMREWGRVKWRRLRDRIDYWPLFRRTAGQKVKWRLAQQRQRLFFVIPET